MYLSYIEKGYIYCASMGRHMAPHRLRTIVADYVSIQNGTKEAPPKSVGKDDTPITRGHYFRGIL